MPEVRPYLTSNMELTSVADAIRAKGKTEAALEFPDEFVSAIEAIRTDPILQDKTVTPDETRQVATFDTEEGYEGLGSVTVEAIPSNYVGSRIPRRTSADLEVDGPEVTVPAGYYQRTQVKDVAEGVYNVSVAVHEITPPTIGGSIDGSVTDILETDVPQGVDGTDYWTVRPGIAMIGNGYSTAKGAVEIEEEGFVYAEETESDMSTKRIDVTLEGGSDCYISAGKIVNNTSGGVSMGEIASGQQIKIGKGYYTSDMYYTAQDGMILSYDATRKRGIISY